ncbi:insecticidal toxin complex protein TcaC1 [Pseudomonas fluorescens Q2-87]|uniref:Insecticidal toxin complex protein TcaC1 n=1 Tax=Pseudomonas fluorescens (strain Q2-87) TaxID=1038922 RepID=J2Y4U8_PSEFQ|nr:SpvB/TcaC N-terminal domain-containing protein [Pseudomonas fluorescens]EJL02176.1 insecticidal toxin complex protein TcaC1 [Pseudomonas fluorescens Q2-87]
MSEHSELPVTAPSLPKGGGAIQSIGKGWNAIGAHGTASYDIALPISPGRGFAPSLSLGYASSCGNGVFGLGWGLSLPCVARRTSQGVPAYTEDDPIIGTGGELWLPERDTQGNIRSTRVDRYNSLELERTYTVTRHFPRIESSFERIEYWSPAPGEPGFWLVHGADGSLHVYGKNHSARRADPRDARRVGEWLLEESLNAHGEHILYQYKVDVTGQRYLSRVSYGNFQADADLYLWKTDRLKAVQWHFELLFDYGERSTQYQEKPHYEGQQWLARDDVFSSFAYGFELRTERLCRQVLMFHRFADECGADPVLVRRLLLDYRQTEQGYQHLIAVHDQAFGESQTPESRPPIEFSYSEFKLLDKVPGWQPWPNMSELTGSLGCQWVDLYGEGLPGVLYQGDGGWYYREPTRAKANTDEVTYGQWQALPRIPVADTTKPMLQSLRDLTGDGRLDWVIAQPGWSGFFALGTNRDWSDFATFGAFPAEFCHRHGQLADLMGAGLSDLAMIGPRSVRLYANQRHKGFAAAREATRDEEADALPVIGPSLRELVAFSDILGSGQQHLVRIRHNEVKCWPNLGHGRFGNGIVLGSPDLADESFDPSRIRLADLDGSGATDLIYLQANQALIFMNRGGNGFSPPVALPWPPGIHYDSLCQVSIADVQGLGCSSLILSLPHRGDQHWRCDFVREKPYLLTGTHNNTGAAHRIAYRSSAQEWLDEKAERTQADSSLDCHVPLILQVVSSQTQMDEITGNRLCQTFAYRQGYYDGIEREFCGFGLLLKTDQETRPGNADSPDFTAPSLTKTWFHTGQALDLPRLGYSRADTQAAALGPTVLCQYQPESGGDTLIASPTSTIVVEMSRALNGRLLRSEVFGVDPQLNGRTLYSVQENRYRIRLLQASTGHLPYASSLPLLLESIRYQYEGITDDPQCQHTFNLHHDAYGALAHSITAHYARRKTVDDPPPFSDIDQQRWWRDAHDPVQQFHYLSETRAVYIHLPAPQGWRLGLPYRQRTNAHKRPKAPQAGGLSTRGMSYEKLIELTEETTWATQSVLTSLSVHRYKDARTAKTLPDGVAHFEALSDHLETAELDDTALQAFHVLPQASRPQHELLESIGYHHMDAFLPATSPQGRLWSVKSGFATYAPLQGFYKIQTQQASESHGLTTFSYDAYHCCITAFKVPDGRVTRALYDYRTLVPWRITDPNGNTQEGRVDAFGQILATTFYGKENNTPVGFLPIAQFERPSFNTPNEAIEQSSEALQNAATALYYAPFSWMGCVSKGALVDSEWLARCVLNHDLLPGGHICASARARLADLRILSVDELKLKQEIDAAIREPVHIAVLTADRYPTDDQQQIRIAITCFDGFGRTLQSKQRVESGMAYIIDANGALTLKDATPVEQTAPTRWRVSERVEYNHKGLPIRLYRPYFANQHRYINDASLRRFGHFDQQFYDALGRPTRTRLAQQNGLSLMRRQTRYAWYALDEDENDTLEKVMAEHVQANGGEA